MVKPEDQASQNHDAMVVNFFQGIFVFVHLIKRLAGGPKVLRRKGLYP